MGVLLLFQETCGKRDQGGLLATQEGENYSTSWEKKGSYSWVRKPPMGTYGKKKGVTAKGEKRDDPFGREKPDEQKSAMFKKANPIGERQKEAVSEREKGGRDGSLCGEPFKERPEGGPVKKEGPCEKSAPAISGGERYVPNGRRLRTKRETKTKNGGGQHEDTPVVAEVANGGRGNEGRGERRGVRRAAERVLGETRVAPGVSMESIKGGEPKGSRGGDWVWGKKQSRLYVVCQREENTKTEGVRRRACEGGRDTHTCNRDEKSWPRRNANSFATRGNRKEQNVEGNPEGSRLMHRPQR